MAHVRTQLRNAVIARLARVPSIASSVPRSRLERDLQDDEFPAAAVAVTETSTPIGSGQPGQRPVKRDFVVQIGIGIRMDEEEDPETRFDAIAVDVEKSLADPSELAVGSVSGWQYAGTGDPNAAAAEAGLYVAPLVYRCSITTKDTEPEANLRP